jgi:multisubunit Na+/H+ antiporter MnhF subunit
VAAVTAWHAAAVALAVALGACGWAASRGRLAGRVAALELASAVSVTLLLCVAQATRRASFEDLALALALLSFPAGLLYARFLEDTP